MNTELLTYAQVAEILQVPVKRITTLQNTDRNFPKVISLGHRTKRIKRTDLEKYING